MRSLIVRGTKKELRDELLFLSYNFWMPLFGFCRVLNGNFIMFSGPVF
ncbi:hypothetical protein LINGRAHAP2_LOCUS30621, partial [Linum grandiflorum]